MSVKEGRDQDDIGKKSDQHAGLEPGYFLDILFRFYGTNVSRTELGAFFMKPGVDQAAQANAKHRFEEQEG